MEVDEISTKNELIDSETQSRHSILQTSNVIKEELIEIDQNDISNLNISTKTKNDYDNQPIKCSLCEHTFMSHEILQDHIATIHKLPQTSIELIDIDNNQNDNSIITLKAFIYMHMHMDSLLFFIYI